MTLDDLITPEHIALLMALSAYRELVITIQKTATGNYEMALAMALGGDEWSANQLDSLAETLYAINIKRDELEERIKPVWALCSQEELNDIVGELLG